MFLPSTGFFSLHFLPDLWWVGDKQIVRLGIHNDTNLGDAPVVADFSDRYGGRGTATAEDRQVGGL